jgi:hypothetical protein
MRLSGRSWTLVIVVPLVLSVLPARAAQHEKEEPDPCGGLLKPEDAQRIVGSAVKHEVKPGQGYLPPVKCRYVQASPGAKPPIVVTVTFGRNSSEGADMMFSAFKAEKDHTEALKGIGDEAILLHGNDGRGGLSDTVVVRKGKSFFILGAGKYDREPLDAFKEVAKKMADRL